MLGCDVGTTSRIASFVDIAPTIHPVSLLHQKMAHLDDTHSRSRGTEVRSAVSNTSRHNSKETPQCFENTPNSFGVDWNAYPPVVLVTVPTGTFRALVIEEMFGISFCNGQTEVLGQPSLRQLTYADEQNLVIPRVIVNGVRNSVRSRRCRSPSIEAGRDGSGIELRSIHFRFAVLDVQPALKLCTCSV